MLLLLKNASWRHRADSAVMFDDEKAAEGTSVMRLWENMTTNHVFVTT
jgi:hypothetical protein